MIAKTKPLAVDVVAAARTPVGRHGGALSSVRVDDLASLVISELLDRGRVEPEMVDEVVAGVVNASGEAMGNLARNAARLAGLPVTTPGFTLNRYCASGMTAVSTAAQMIAAGAAEVVIVVGAESMSRSTWPLPKPARAFAMGPIVGRDAMFSGGGGPQHPELESLGDLIEMPQTAQNLAERFGLSREQMDAWAERSHRLAGEAADAGHFDEQIVAVPTGEAPVTEDETIRRDTSLERLARLRPYAEGAPEITAGNSSPVNDGASGLVLAAPEARERLDLPLLARLTGAADAGVEPAYMGLGAAAAVERLPIDVGGVDLIEINEAFASVALACVEQLGVESERVNVNGGAIALGHALGNSGTRLLVTLIHELHRRGGGSGVATLCVGGGQGAAASVEVRPDRGSG